MLAWVYISTGNVIYTILGHMAINMRAVLREGLLHRALENPLMARYEEGKIGLLELWRGRDTAVVLYLADELLVGLIVLAGLILLTVLLVRYLKKRKQGLPVPAEAAAAAEEPEAPAAATEPEAPAAAEEPEAPVPAAAPVRRRKRRVLLGSLGMWFYLLVTLAFFVLNYI